MFLTWWSGGPDYGERIGYFARRGLLRPFRFVVACCALLLGGISAALLIGVERQSQVAAAIQAAGLVLAAFWVIVWLRGRVPSFRVAVVFVFSSSLSILAVSLADSDVMMGAFGLSCLTLTATFAAVMLPPLYFVAHALLTVLSVAAFVGPLWVTYGPVIAVIKTVVLLSCVVAVPAAVQVASCFLSRDAAESYTDPMCDILNRRGFLQSSRAHVARSFRAGRAGPVDVVAFVVDVDRHKQINDSHGHAAGDDVLVGVAHVLRALAANIGGVVGRIGGDEFAMIVSGPRSGFDCVRLGERICGAIRTSVSTPGGPVTVSVGTAVATVSTDEFSGEAVTALIARADAALYRAKVTRDCVMKEAA